MHALRFGTEGDALAAEAETETETALLEGASRLDGGAPPTFTGALVGTRIGEEVGGAGAGEEVCSTAVLVAWVDAGGGGGGAAAEVV